MQLKEIINFKKSAIFCLCFAILAPIYASTFIKPNSDLLEFSGYGIKYTSDTLVSFARFSEDVINDTATNFKADYGRTDGGIILYFRTKSSHIKVTFRQIAGGGDLPGTWTRTAFGVFQNDTFDYQDNDLTIETNTKHPGESVLYQITFPSYWNVALTGIYLDNDATLLPTNRPKKPIYAAIGNSITHGTGQQNLAFQTYPFKLSRKAGWDYLNLAVGGARTSPPVARMLTGKNVDIITILYGYNDCSWKDSSAFHYRYEKLLTNLRKDHPTTPIYCITLITTTHEENGDAPREEYRNIIRNIVAQRKSNGDQFIYILEGEKLTKAEDLSDGIHLNYTNGGTSRFADSLYKYIDINAIGATNIRVDNIAKYGLAQKNSAVPKIFFNSQKLFISSNRQYKNARIDIFKPNGSKIKSIFVGNIKSGTQVILNDKTKIAELMSAGIYCFRLSSDNVVVSKLLFKK